MNRWLQELVALGVLAVGGGAWLMADADLAWELHEVSAAQTPVADFESAKDHLYEEIDFEDNRVRGRYSDTFVDLEQSGSGHLRPTAGVDAEHTWASNATWAHPDDRFDYDTEKGTDLHNLFPARAGLNRSRGNHPFRELPGDAVELLLNPTTGFLSGGTLRTGSFRRYSPDHAFEPRDGHKGDVARAMFYMSVRYWMPIPDDMENDLRAWHEQDPVSLEELARNGRVEAIQGNRNPFIDRPELVDEINDF